MFFLFVFVMPCCKICGFNCTWIFCSFDKLCWCLLSFFLLSLILCSHYRVNNKDMSVKTTEQGFDLSELSCRIPVNSRDLPSNYKNWLIRAQMFVPMAQCAKTTVDHWLPSITGGYHNPFHLGTKALSSCVAVMIKWDKSKCKTQRKNTDYFI